LPQPAISTRFREGTIEQPLDARREISLRLTVLARMLRADFDRQVGDFGITRSQWSLVAAVASRPGSTQRVIADLLDMSEASAGRQIDRLVAEGMLERREREDDRRARAVYVTEKANPLLEALSALARRREAMLFHGMDSDDLEKLRTLLQVVYTNVSCPEARAACNPGGRED
jgi:MarR family transcriptional regulator for hemolysin